MSNKVFVCTLSFNCYPLTATVIEAIKLQYKKENILLCIIDNNSTDEMRIYHEKNRAGYDIFVPNERNIGTMFAINQMIKLFMESDCEWFIYHEGDAVPCSYRPAETLLRLVERLKRVLVFGESWPRVIGFEMSKWPTYPLKKCLSREPYDVEHGPILVNSEPLPDPNECKYMIPQVPEDEMLSADMESKEAWNHLMEGTERPIGATYASTRVYKVNPLWMSLAIHRSVWEKLGYFDESDQHGDVDFYRRYLHLGWDMGISTDLQFLANDFQYSKYYMDAGRWQQLKLFRNLEELHQASVQNAIDGEIYRGSIFDAPSIVRYNPIVGGQGTYNWHAIQNLEWLKKNAQLDCSKEPCWLEENSPKFKQFKDKLIGKLEFVGDRELANEVSKWKK